MPLSERKRRYDLEFQREYREQRRRQAVEFLGGRCVRCGATEGLEFDHVDRAVKSFTITARLNVRWERLVAELEKCQLLCKPCHITKTREERDAARGLVPWETEPPHGTLARYSARHGACRCEECVAWRKAYQRELVDSRGRPGRRERNPLGPRLPERPQMLWFLATACGVPFRVTMDRGRKILIVGSKSVGFKAQVGLD